MFVKAIENATLFTRPIYSISRNYKSTTIQPGTASLFFVNSDGWALTCGHVANQIIAAEDINKKHIAFKNELSSNIRQRNILKDLEHKYGLTETSTFELYNSFVNCVDGKLELTIIKHPQLDIALIKFNNYNRLLCNTFPFFSKDTSTLKQGKYLCRLGFPFPEFTNYEYDTTNDTIKWNGLGNTNTPQFPIEGMLTRNIADAEKNIIGFEISTPGLRGQSGGPVFDIDGKIWGIQSSTAHLDLNFDVDIEVLRNGVKKHVTDSAFLHVGHCIHINVIKNFLNDKNVKYNEI
jgi:hypothetical protein